MVPGPMLTARAASAAGAIGHALRGQRMRRVVWRGNGRLHIAVHGVTRERDTALARAVEARLRRHPSVSWAAVNGPLGTVVVDCGDEVSSDELVGIVEEVERDHDVQPETVSDRPAPDRKSVV